MSDDPRLSLVRIAIASAIGVRLESRFRVELLEWAREAGIDTLGTDPEEAAQLTHIAVDTVKEVTDAEIAERIAEYMA